MGRAFSLRRIFWWLAPSATVGTLTGAARVATFPPTSISVDTIARLSSRYLESVRTVRVFLPPDYAQGHQHYPVLYINDGQDAEPIGLVPTLDSLYAARAIEPIIVVAIHATDDRMQEYGVSGIPNAQGFGGKAANYEKFFIRELVPLVNRRYRTEHSPEKTALAGWSLGALSAFDLAWRHPEVFGTLGAFSGSFWWRTNDSTPATRQASRVVHRIVREAKSAPALRAWFEAGRQDETDDRDGNGVIDAIQDTKELMDALGEKGLRQGRTMQYVEMEGGHNPETWGKALPQFLRWTFGRK